MTSEKSLRKEGRGSFDYKVDANSELSVVRWFDNRAVQLSSTHFCIEPITSVRRLDRRKKKHVDVLCPAIVTKYNEHMGGVDKFDMLAALYRIDHKSTKWFRRKFYLVSQFRSNQWLDSLSTTFRSAESFKKRSTGSNDFRVSSCE